jgi:hypothetical protein
MFGGVDLLRCRAAHSVTTTGAYQDIKAITVGQRHARCTATRKQPKRQAERRFGSNYGHWPRGTNPLVSPYNSAWKNATTLKPDRITDPGAIAPAI